MGRTHLALLLSGMTLLVVPASASAVPTVTIGNNPVVAEGNELIYEVSLSEAPTSRVSVNIQTSAAYSYATAGVDYLAKSQKLVFAAGQSMRPFKVTTIDDATDDRDTAFNGEYVWAHITGVSAGLALPPDDLGNQSPLDRWGLGVMLDNDGMPTLTMSNNPVALEGSPLDFTLSLSHPSDYVITAKVHTVLGYSMASADDFTAASDTLTFSPGSTVRTFTVQTVQDALLEPLSNGFGPGEYISVHTYEVGDDDPDAERVTWLEFTNNMYLDDLWALGFIDNTDDVPAP